MKFGMWGIRKIKKIPLIVICGPTAVGKSNYAVQLAKEKNGEIISADSRQVYTLLDIGTAKITPEEMRGIPHHMIDIIHPTKIMTVTEYQKQATQLILDISSRRKIPLLVGGTGQYIDAVVFGRQYPTTPPNPYLRKSLEKMSTEELFHIIQRKDPRRAQSLDRNNRRRLIRAIEIAETGQSPKDPLTHRNSPYDVTWMVMDKPDDELRGRIHKRNIQRIENGLIDEVRNLHETHQISWERLDQLGLEYRYVSHFLQGNIHSKEELVMILDQKTWQYVKRQRTWFRKFT